MTSGTQGSALALGGGSKEESVLVPSFKGVTQIDATGGLCRRRRDGCWRSPSYLVIPCLSQGLGMPSSAVWWPASTRKAFLGMHKTSAALGR